MVCKNLKRPPILGLDFHKTLRIGTNWSHTRKFILNHNKQFLVEAIEIKETDHEFLTKCSIIVPARTLTVLNVRVDVDKTHTDHLFEVQSNPLLCDMHPNLALLSVIHNMDNNQTDQIQFVVIKLSTEKIYLENGDILGFLEEINITINELMTETVYQTTFQKEEKRINVLNTPTKVTKEKKCFNRSHWYWSTQKGKATRYNDVPCTSTGFIFWIKSILGGMVS